MVFPDSAPTGRRQLDGLDEPLQVVFIGDDPAIADMYRLKLELDGYAVTLVTSEQARSDAPRMPTPDLLYLDLGLLNPSSIAMYRRLRARSATKHLPIVLLATRFSGQGATRLELGIRDLLISSETTRQGSYWNVYSEVMLSGL